MSKRSLLAVLLLCLSPLTSPDRALAQIDHREMEREGWTSVQEGVLRRELRPNEVETIVSGVEGFTWKLQDLRSQLRILRGEFAAQPTPELRKAIESHRQVIASTLKMIEQARKAEAEGEMKTVMITCSGTTQGGYFTYDADASSKTERQGVWANASVDYQTIPGCNFSGEVYAYAFAKTTVNGAATTATVTDGPRSGAYVNASAEASRNGGFACESYSYASVTDAGTSYSKSTSNASCPVPSPPASPLQVSVTSDQPSTINLSASACQDINWTVNISGGTPPYRSKIYSNDLYATHGTTYHQWICGSGQLNAFYGSSITIRAEVIDSGGQSRSASHTTTVEHSWEQEF